MNPPEDPDIRRIEAMLRAIDPGREAAKELSRKGRDRVLWSWRHPLLAWCIRHHALIATVVALATVAALAVWMVRRQCAERERLSPPDPVSAPVRI